MTPRGLRTALMASRDRRGFEIELDFVDHQLVVSISDGTRRSLPLEPKSVATFYAEVMQTLDELGLSTRVWPVPVEIEGAIPFDRDHEHASYEPPQVRAFGRALVQMDRVLYRFRAGFVGKASPVHFFWGGFDLAVTRFSGRPAPPYTRPAANCGPHVMREAYSHEVSSCGYWPAPDGEGIFYSYAYPEPDGFRDAPAGPPGARYDDALGEFVLPYEIVRGADDPDAVLLEFLQRTYEAAADNGGWDRASLERRD